MGSTGRDSRHDEENQEQRGQHPPSDIIDDEIPDEETVMEATFTFEQDERDQVAVTEPESDDFFPFPNEKFFLLYCYAHSVMRPKVKRRKQYLFAQAEFYFVLIYFILS